MPIMNREMRRQLERENTKRPAVLTIVPREQWPVRQPDPARMEVWVSREYLVQVFDEGNGVQRLTANRTTARPGGRWDDGLTWNELQAIKRAIGRGDLYAVEIYPRDRDIMNVANMRHLWMLPAPLRIGWFKTPMTLGPKIGMAAMVFSYLNQSISAESRAEHSAY